MKNESGKRYLLWDDTLLDSADGVRINRHKPERKNVAFVCDREWEGITCGYPAVMKVGDKYRFYYRASGINEMAKGESFCIAESAVIPASIAFFTSS